MQGKEGAVDKVNFTSRAAHLQSIIAHDSESLQEVMFHLIIYSSISWTWERDTHSQYRNWHDNRPSTINELLWIQL
jgi:hypothetical protein